MAEPLGEAVVLYISFTIGGLVTLAALQLLEMNGVASLAGFVTVGAGIIISTAYPQAAGFGWLTALAIVVTGIKIHENIQNNRADDFSYR